MKKILETLINMFKENGWVYEKTDEQTIFRKHQKGSNENFTIVKVWQRFGGFDVEIYSNGTEHLKKEVSVNNQDYFGILELAEEKYELQRKVLDWAVNSRRRKMRVIQ